MYAYSKGSTLFIYYILPFLVYENLTGGRRVRLDLHNTGAGGD